MGAELLLRADPRAFVELTQERVDGLIDNSLFLDELPTDTWGSVVVLVDITEDGIEVQLVLDGPVAVGIVARTTDLWRVLRPEDHSPVVAGLSSRELLVTLPHLGGATHAF